VWSDSEGQTREKNIAYVFKRISVVWTWLLVEDKLFNIEESQRNGHDICSQNLNSLKKTHTHTKKKHQQQLIPILKRLFTHRLYVDVTTFSFSWTEGQTGEKIYIFKRKRIGVDMHSYKKRTLKGSISATYLEPLKGSIHS